MLITFQAGAGSLTEYAERGDFFRLMHTAAEVDVFFYRAGREIARAESVTGGYAERFGVAFDRIAIASAVAQSVQFVCRDGNEVHFDAPPMGLVTVANTGGAFSQAAAVVGVASAQLLAANPARRFLLIQNNDAAGDIYITVDGSAATAAHGLKIAAGGALELAAFVPVGAIHAIGSGAGLAVVVVEG
jgi:hypothetical protein